MPLPDLLRDGMTEACVEFGADLLGSQGLSISREARFTLGLGDISTMYRGAFRAQAVSKLAIPPGGAGQYGGVLLYAPPTGLWVRHLAIAAGATAVWSIVSPTTAATYAGWALNNSWNAWGDDQGLLTASTLVGLGNGGFLHRPTLFGTTDPTAPLTFAIDATGGIGNVLPCDIWVQPLGVFYIQNAAANASMNVSLLIQFTSNNPGRFP